MTKFGQTEGPQTGYGIRAVTGFMRGEAYERRPIFAFFSVGAIFYDSPLRIAIVLFSLLYRWVFTHAFKEPLGNLFINDTAAAVILLLLY